MQNDMTYSIVLGARKNFVPGTIAYTRLKNGV
jgi:hypothetical protein